jgi:hypothetical protein
MELRPNHVYCWCSRAFLIDEYSSGTHSTPNTHASAQEFSIPSPQLLQASDDLANASYNAINKQIPRVLVVDNVLMPNG